MSSLFSPGSALFERASLEIAFASVATASVRQFLDQVIALAGPTGRLNSGEVHGAWNQVAWTLIEFEAGYLGLPTVYRDRVIHSDVLRERMAVLKGQSLPDLVFSSASAALRENPADLRQVLSLDSSTASLTAGLGFLGRTWRAILNAFVRTESTALKNSKMMFTLLDKGVRDKRWVAHHDDKTRPTHLAVDGMVTSLNQPFQVGGSMLLYPGDHTGPAQEVLNCRCVIVGVR